MSACLPGHPPHLQQASPLRGWRRVPPSLPCGSGEGRVTRPQVTLPAGQPSPAQPRPGNRLPCPTHKVPPHQNKKEEGGEAATSESRVTAAPPVTLPSAFLRTSQGNSKTQLSPSHRRPVTLPRGARGEEHGRLLLRLPCLPPPAETKALRGPLPPSHLVFFIVFFPARWHACCLPADRGGVVFRLEQILTT